MALNFTNFKIKQPLGWVLLFLLFRAFIEKTLEGYYVAPSINRDIHAELQIASISWVQGRPLAINATE